MARVEYDGFSCQLRSGESVLDGLLRAGVAVPHSCRAGSCGSCMMRAVAPSTATSRSQAGLKDSWKVRGYFLACVCHPDADLAAGPVDAESRCGATIASLDRLSDSVLRVCLATATPLEYHAGQFITVFLPDGLARSYSVASLPVEDVLELHVRLLPGGRMSQWFAGQASVGDELQIQGPSGDCFYLAGREDSPLLLAGTGTGLSPLYGIARDALGHGHRGPIYLFHGAVTSAGLYLQDQLERLGHAHPNFTYIPTTLEAGGPIDQAILTRFPELTGWRAFVCGDPVIVHSLKKKVFLAGARLKDIHADAFVTAPAV